MAPCGASYAFFKICTSHKKVKDLVDFLWNDLVSIEVWWWECWFIKRFDLKCLLLCWTRQLNKYLYCTQYFSSIFSVYKKSRSCGISKVQSWFEIAFSYRMAPLLKFTIVESKRSFSAVGWTTTVIRCHLSDSTIAIRFASQEPFFESPITGIKISLTFQINFIKSLIKIVIE